MVCRLSARLKVTSGGQLIQSRELHRDAEAHSNCCRSVAADIRTLHRSVRSDIRMQDSLAHLELTRQLAAMLIASRKTNRTSLAIGWEAAKANAVPAFILQGAMLVILISYYLSPACADFLNRLAHYKEQHGLVFVVVAAILAGAIVPELFVIVFFQRGRVRRAKPPQPCLHHSDVGCRRNSG